MFRPANKASIAVRSLLRLAPALVVTAAVVAVTLAAPGRPASAQAVATPEALFATVLEVAPPDSLTVLTGSGARKLVIRPETTVKVGDEPVTFDQIATGDRVVATALLLHDGSYLGIALLIRPAQDRPVTKHIVGVVVSVGVGSVGIQDRSGDTVTVDVGAGIALPGIGEAVTAVATIDSATRKFLVRSFESAAATVEKIREAADSATDVDQARRLREALEAARNKHLSAIDEAKRALERAREQLELAQEAAEQASIRLEELQQRFNSLVEQYRGDAQSRGEATPLADVKGEWASFGAETFVISTAEGPVVLSYDENTRAGGTAINEQGEHLVIAEFSDGQLDSVLLNDVIADIPTGARAVVSYEPGTQDQLARYVVFVQPELPQAVLDEIKARAKGLFTGIITLVEETPELPLSTGVIAVDDFRSGRKALVRITVRSEVILDGEPARIGDLSLGQIAEVLFDEAESGEASGASAVASRGLLDAVAVRAWTQVSDAETHISGLIRTINPDERSVVIAPVEGEQFSAIVSEVAFILKDGERATFRDLAVGDLVLDATRYVRTTRTITRLLVHSARELKFSGLVTGIEGTRLQQTESAAADEVGSYLIEALKVTVMSSDGNTISMFVTRETELNSLVKGPIDPSDLNVGDVVIDGTMQTVTRAGHVFVFARKMIIGEAEVDSLRGIVVGVDAENGVLVVDHAERGKVELHMPTPPASAALFKNDQRVRSLAQIVVGDIVEYAAYETVRNVLVKLYVVSPNLARISGVIGRLDRQGGVIVVQSKGDADARSVELVVYANTTIVFDGRKTDSLDIVSTGDIVASGLYTFRPENVGGNLALFLYVLSQRRLTGDTAVELRPTGEPAQASVEAAVSGVIESVDGEVMVIGGQKFVVNSDTQFFGDTPAAGLVARAALVADSRGVFVAAAVSVAGRPSDIGGSGPVDIKPVDPFTIPAGPEGFSPIAVWVSGVIKATSGNTVSMGGVRFLITPETVMSGRPALGLEARALLVKRKDGTTVALNMSTSDEPAVVRPASPPAPDARPLR